MLAGDPLKGVAGVDDEAGLGGDPGIVTGRVVRHQQHKAGFFEGGLDLKVIKAHDASCHQLAGPAGTTSILSDVPDNKPRCAQSLPSGWFWAASPRPR
jgi:hypothetical protein